MNKHWPNNLGDLAEQKRAQSLSDAAALSAAKADLLEIQEIATEIRILLERVERLRRRHKALLNDTAVSMTAAETMANKAAKLLAGGER